MKGLQQRFAALLLACMTLALPTVATAAQATASARGELLVLAAASLTDVLQTAGAAYTRATGQAVKFSFAGSSALARQIEAGAAADLFISADLDWMDYVEARRLLRPGTRCDLLGNRLVLIAPAASRLQLTPAPGFPLRSALGSGRLALADPESVPAGRYGRAALQQLGAWDSVRAQLVLADSVRTALGFVSRGEAPLGIVYETDALADRRVRVLGRFPEGSHPAIVYPAALLAAARPGSADFLAFLRSPAAQPIFRQAGFLLPAAR